MVRGFSVLAFFALVLSVGCGNVEILINDSGRDGLEGNADIFDADLNGAVGQATPAQGRVDRALGWEDLGQLVDVELESTVANGGAMAMMFMYDLVTPDTPSGSVFVAKAFDDDDVVMDDSGDTYIRIDDDDDVQAVSEGDLSGVECSGPGLGNYDYDEPVDNVAVRVEDCTDCEQADAKRIDYAMWNEGEPASAATRGTFYWAPSGDDQQAGLDDEPSLRGDEI